MATCETCRWWVKPSGTSSHGICHRYPRGISKHHSNWCGEWRATQAAEDAAMQAAIKEAFDD